MAYQLLHYSRHSLGQRDAATRDAECAAPSCPTGNQVPLQVIRHRRSLVNLCTRKRRARQRDAVDTMCATCSLLLELGIADAVALFFASETLRFSPSRDCNDKSRARAPMSVARDFPASFQARHAARRIRFLARIFAQLSKTLCRAQLNYLDLAQQVNCVRRDEDLLALKDAPNSN